MALFEIEEQVAVKRVNQQGGAEGASDLREDVERQFAFFKVGENAQGNTDGRVQVRAGNTRGQVDRHADANAPDNADFPQAKAGAGDFERGNATGTKEDQ
ncbi:hypothetical protein D3C84_854500 [compost metagenome]